MMFTSKRWRRGQNVATRNGRPGRHEPNAPNDETTRPNGTLEYGHLIMAAGRTSGHYGPRRYERDTVELACSIVWRHLKRVGSDAWPQPEQPRVCRRNRQRT